MDMCVGVLRKVVWVCGEGRVLQPALVAAQVPATNSAERTAENSSSLPIVSSLGPEGPVKLKNEVSSFVRSKDFAES